MDIQNLVSFCPILSFLELASFEGINHLTVQAPKLKHIYVVGDFKDIIFDAPNLEGAILFPYHKGKAYPLDPIALHKESYVKQLLGSLSDIKSLAISGFLLMVRYYYLQLYYGLLLAPD